MQNSTYIFELSKAMKLLGIKKVMKSLEVGDTIEAQQFNPETKQTDWVRTQIKKVSKDFVWFNGSGYSRIKRTTIEQGIFYRRV